MKRATIFPIGYTNRFTKGYLPSSKRSQQGVALIVALILLVVIALVGLAASRSTIIQQKMSSNLYDREVAFQSAEAALRVAAARLGTFPADVSRNCTAGGTTCFANPFADPNLPSGAILSVPTGTGVGQYTAGSNATGQPQYVVENMGNWADASSSTGFNQSANSNQYGAQGKSTTSVYYRVTARSGDPAKVGDRGVVVLQAMVKQG
jgi:type IV pilus assembly protein PilX